jgi:hypothetical protein
MVKQISFLGSVLAFYTTSLLSLFGLEKVEKLLHTTLGLFFH